MVILEGFKKFPRVADLKIVNWHFSVLLGVKISPPVIFTHLGKTTWPYEVVPIGMATSIHCDSLTSEMPSSQMILIQFLPHLALKKMTEYF